MKRRSNLKTAMVGLLAASVLAFGATAQAVTLDAGILGDVNNKTVINVPDPGNPGGSGLFLDTINFDLGSFTHFNMTSQFNSITAFGAPIFENDGDTEVIAASATHTAVPLADLGLPRDYHLHPQGLAPAGVGYTLTLWGSTAGGPAVPLPAAAWLFGSGVIGLAGLARRKMAA